MFFSTKLDPHKLVICIYQSQEWYRKEALVVVQAANVDTYRERHRDRNRILPQKSALVRVERIGRYSNVSVRNRSSQIGDPDRDDRVTSKPNRGLNRANPIGTYMTVSEQETRSRPLK